jgi:hypothetical protein
MSRVQLALNVTDLDAAVAFYSKLFATQPNKLRPGYANFAISEPPLKLVLIEGTTGGTLSHLGVEVESAGAVVSAEERLTASGLTTMTEDKVACCYALQDKVWVDDPDGAAWEVYTVLADVDMPVGQLRTTSPSQASEGMCCDTEAPCCPK